MELQTTFRDYAGKDGQCSVIVDPAISGANATAVWNAISAMALGTPGNSYLASRDLNDTGSTSLPSDKFAQRTTKFRVEFTDDVNGEPGYFTIPTADLSLLAVNSHYVDLSGTEAAALVTALETYAKSRDGNAITVAYILEVSKAGQ